MSKAGAEFTVDAFHRGRFHVVQPARGHRSGVDAMLLASLVPANAAGRLADLGAGSGAAGLAVAAREPGVTVTLVEKSAAMADCARRTLELPENADIAGRASVLQADVTLSGKLRFTAGLRDDAFEHVIMNPPFNDASDRRTPDALKAEAHAMTAGLLEAWIKTASALARPGAQLSLIARPQSVADIVAGCGRRFGGLQITPVHPRQKADAIRILVTAIKGSRARLTIRPPLVLHQGEANAFTAQAAALNNGEAVLGR